MSTNPQPATPVVHVGDYTLLSRIGEGGMGVVHLARRTDGHRVALKVLRPHIVGDDEARERLAREVNSLSRIRSRWVAEIEDADPYGPIPYVATRYVPGLSLHDHVHEDGPIADLAWFAARLADGLDAVHSVGVLHRDIKPSNVLMEGRAPILIDFGLARVADDPRLTHTGWLLGTPGYLAPEILHGEDATTASDVHSWAATVAFAGTGNPPFGRGPSMAIMDRVRRGEHDLSGVPGDLRDLLHAALSPEPAERPTLDQIRDYLGRALGGPVGPPMTVPMVAAPASPAEARTDAFEKSTLVWPTQAAEFDPFAPWPDEESDQQPVGPAAPGWALRLRRGMLSGSLLAAAAIGIGLAPYVATAVLVGLVWVLRAGSLAASRHVDRRVRRGPRWYDAVALPLSYPWFVVIAIPGLVMLGFWSGGLALAAALVCFALATPLAVTLVATGAVLSASMWWGPGGSRFRGPVRRVVDAVSDGPWVWTLVTGMLVIGTIAGAVLLGDQGVDWTPADAGPLARDSFLSGLF